jgi:hypothetical protein
MVKAMRRSLFEHCGYRLPVSLHGKYRTVARASEMWSKTSLTIVLMVVVGHPFLKRASMGLRTTGEKKG